MKNFWFGYSTTNFNKLATKIINNPCDSFVYLEYVNRLQTVSISQYENIAPDVPFNVSFEVNFHRMWIDNMQL